MWDWWAGVMEELPRGKRVVAVVLAVRKQRGTAQGKWWRGVDPTMAQRVVLRHILKSERLRRKEASAL